MYDVAIIGGGIIGTFIARELSRYKLKIVLLEKESEIANGTTKANSAIVHAGYDAHPGTQKAKFNALGNPMFDDICKELQVPFKRIGSFVIATNEEEMKVLQELYQRGLDNGIPNMEIISGQRALELEPNLTKAVIGALYARTGGIVGPWELAIALAENAAQNGVEIKVESKVLGITKSEGGYLISTENGGITSKYIINCAGVYADEIHNMVSKPTFKIMPRRGQYNVFDKSAGTFVNRVIFQCPNDMGKGVLIAPTVHGNLLAGPTAENLDSKDALETTMESLNYLKTQVKKSAEKVPFNAVITAFAGLRARTDNDDFIIAEAEDAKGFIDVAGIESPGLSAAPAIASYVVQILEKIAGRLVENKDFNPVRKVIVQFMELSDNEKAELIKKDPRYGRIICRCENVTEGEIIDAINRPAGARTLDGIKRRVRPGSGRCQGGFCGPRVMEIIARELKVDIMEVKKDGRMSYILTGPTKIDAITEEYALSAAAAGDKNGGVS